MRGLVTGTFEARGILYVQEAREAARPRPSTQYHSLFFCVCPRHGFAIAGATSICVARVSLQKETRCDEVLAFRAIGARRLRRRWEHKKIGRWTDVAHHHHDHVHRLVRQTCRRDYCSVSRNTRHVANNFAVQLSNVTIQ